jgi:hypothetical protein
MRVVVCALSDDGKVKLAYETSGVTLSVAAIRMY